MKKMKMIFLLALLFAPALFAIDYSQDDRDRLIRLETKVDEMTKRMDEQREFLLWGFGILFAGMGTLIGFVLWDRRSVVTPVAREVEELKRKERMLEQLMEVLRANDPVLDKRAREIGFGGYSS